eukprot:CAMPEP_0119424070 /NCGR_PEP_ID=MMETSP1335-20130426/31761_1 /TAXON_ID=259385 /ORGANISM="Chrysoculter rhomboideus, Strain RCC1486" /LENGTH=82 /DNA_ID=CAMNT_0007449583 /DNA_START=284 /DNA_END=528 /DNA_ORIENTATION=+
MARLAAQRASAMATMVEVGKPAGGGGGGIGGGRGGGSAAPVGVEGGLLARTSPAVPGVATAAAVALRSGATLFRLRGSERST